MLTDERLNEIYSRFDITSDVGQMALELLSRRRAEREGGKDLCQSCVYPCLLDKGMARVAECGQYTPASDKAASDLSDLEERVAALEAWRKEQEASR